MRPAVENCGPWNPFHVENPYLDGLASENHARHDGFSKSWLNFELHQWNGVHQLFDSHVIISYHIISYQHIPPNAPTTMAAHPLFEAPVVVTHLQHPGRNANMYMGVSKNRGTPKSSIFNKVFHYKPSILGYPYFWKHPYIYIYIQKASIDVKCVFHDTFNLILNMLFWSSLMLQQHQTCSKAS